MPGRLKERGRSTRAVCGLGSGDRVCNEEGLDLKEMGNSCKYTDVQSSKAEPSLLFPKRLAVLDVD
jgi:hypothetical protein